MSPERSLFVPAGVDRGIRRHGQETYPHECCGAIVGNADRAVDVVPLPNTTEEGPRRRFLIRPSEYTLAERRAQDLGLELLGFYHSHPDHPARPSQTDLDYAWPNFAYIIVSVVDGDAALPGRSAGAARASVLDNGAKAGDMTVWYLKDDRSSFDEGVLNGENSHSDTVASVHGQAGQR